MKLHTFWRKSNWFSSKCISYLTWDCCILTKYTCSEWEIENTATLLCPHCLIHSVSHIHKQNIWQSYILIHTCMELKYAVMCEHKKQWMTWLCVCCIGSLFFTCLKENVISEFLIFLYIQNPNTNRTKTLYYLSQRIFKYNFIIEFSPVFI